MIFCITLQPLFLRRLRHSRRLRAEFNGVEATPPDNVKTRLQAHVVVSGALLLRASACCSEKRALIRAAAWRNLGKKRSTPIFCGTADAAKRTVRLANTRSCSRTGTLRLISSARRRERTVVAYPEDLMSASRRCNSTRARAGLS